MIKNLKKLLEESEEFNDLGLSDLIKDAGAEEFVQVDEFDVDEDGDGIATFVFDEDEVIVAFTVSEDGKPIAVIVEDSDEEDGDEEYFDLSDLEVPMKDGKIDFSEDISNWLSPETLLDILDGEDEFEDEQTEEAEEPEMGEASTYVVRGGRKVKKALVRRKRKKS